MLSTTSITGWGQADSREHRAPVLFTKLTPIDLSAYQSVWTITLDWNDSVGATEYEYCFDKTDDDTCDDSWVSTGMNTSAEITFLQANTTYYWQSRAFDGSVYAEADGEHGGRSPPGGMPVFTRNWSKIGSEVMTGALEIQ